jgi:hypothetical protein
MYPIMNAALQHTLLNLIEQQWRSLPPAAQPWGVWIRSYDCVEPDSNGIAIEAWPQAVWFLDHSGLHERDIWVWQRFRVVLIDQPWCQRGFAKEPVHVFGRRHEIGLAAFAPYRNSTDIYLEVIWGGTFGSGWRMGSTMDGATLHQQMIWIS